MEYPHPKEGLPLVHMYNGVRRIAVLSVHASPLARLGEGANGGLTVYVREVCRALGEVGVATDVFTRAPAGERVCVEPLGPLSRVVQIPAGERESDREQLLAIVPDFASGVQAFTAGGGYDLVYSHYWLSGVAAAILRDRLGLPWVHTAHTWAVVKNQGLAPGAQSEPARRVAVEGDIARAADLLVVSTEAERRVLEGTYGIDPERAAVILPGVDLDRFRPRPRDEVRRSLGREGQRLFVIVGRLERLKGVDLALRALAAVVPEHPEARLLVAGGDGGQRGEAERLRTIAIDLGIAGQVEFCGPVPQAQLAQYYAAADACLLPSYTESFGLVGLEAQACGIPVIASKAAGMASVVRDGETAFLVASGDARAYARAMALLLDDPGLVERMGEQAAQLAAGFTWRHTAINLLEQLRKLTAPGHDRPHGGDALASQKFAT